MNKKLISRVLLIAALLAGMLFTPAAHAQGYGATDGSIPGSEPLDPNTVQDNEILGVIVALRECVAITPSSGQNFMTTAGTSTDARDAVITASETLQRCATNVRLEINPILFDAPIPADRKMGIYLPEPFQSPWTVEMTADLISGRTYHQTFVFYDDGRTSATSGSAIATPSQALAFTGGEVSAPLAIGGGLIVAGAMVLFVARRREQD